MQDYPKERRVGPSPPLPQVLLGYAKFRAHWRLLCPMFTRRFALPPSSFFPPYRQTRFFLGRLFHRLAVPRP